MHDASIRRNDDRKLKFWYKCYAWNKDLWSLDLNENALGGKTTLYFCFKRKYSFYIIFSHLYDDENHITIIFVCLRYQDRQTLKTGNNNFKIITCYDYHFDITLN